MSNNEKHKMINIKPNSAALGLMIGLLAAGLGLADTWSNRPINIGNIPGTMPDVNVEVVGDTAYAFCGTDTVTNAPDFNMPYWRLYSSKDLVHWTFESKLDPSVTYMRNGPGTNFCFGGHGLQRNGKWYWYFSDHANSIGVALSDSPKGPWQDPLGKPLIPKGLTSTASYDPCALVDDDGRAYLVFGSQKGAPKGVVNYQIVELNADMISLKGKPQRLMVNGNMGKQLDPPIDASFFHKANGKYYLSWRKSYAVADSPFGSYTFLGNQNAPGHGGYFQFRNQWFRDYTIKFPATGSRYRFCGMCYVHYKDNGEMVDNESTISQYGVGEYDATWPAIEAEWHMGTTATAQKKEIPTGFEMRLHGGDYLLYPYIHNLPANAVVTLKYSSAAASSGTISIRANDQNGAELGTAEIPSTDAWTSYQTLLVHLNTPPGTVSLAFVVKGDAGAELLRLDSFAIQAP